MASKMMTVRIASLASEIKVMRVQEGMTVKEILAKADITADGEIFINGKRAGFGTKCHAEDMIGIVGTVEGGK